MKRNYIFILTLISIAAFVICSISKAKSEQTVLADYQSIAPTTHDGLTSEVVSINHDGRQIYGILTRSANAKGKRLPLAIIAHGFNATHAVGNAYYRTLCDMGYQCFAFDFPYGSLNSKSDNNTMRMSVLTEQSDLEAVVEHFRRQPSVDKKNIMLIGESQGGFVSSLVASDMPNKISRLVLVFPALCIPDNWNARYPDASSIPDTTWLWQVPLGKEFFREVRHIDAFKNMARYKKPVLIIQGDADHVVSVADSRRAASLYKDAQLHIIHGAGHGFNAEQQAEAQRVLKEFLQK